MDCRIRIGIPSVICFYFYFFILERNMIMSIGIVCFFMVKIVGFGEKWRKWVWYFGCLVLNYGLW